MIECKVENHYTALLVTFEDGKTLLIQSDYEQFGFGQDCGFISLLKKIETMGDYDLTDITKCPVIYYDSAE